MKEFLGITHKVRLWCCRVALVLVFASMSACDFQQEANNKFGDQHFKTAIALIELYKVRNGEYPASLNDIKFTGDWDAMALASVQYKKNAKGYRLDLMNGWVGQPKDLNYSQEFWRGLGLNESNMKPQATH